MPKKKVTKPVATTASGDDTAARIIEIVERLDEDGLKTLLGAAKAVETKRKIETFNKELNTVAQEAARRRREAARPDYRVSIERTEDSFFVIQLDQVRVFFNLQEMREITRLCHAAARSAASNPRVDGARRMFRWFENERSDLLADAGINNDASPYLMALYEEVVSNYKLKDE
jgi:hypothetical protein